MDFYIDKKELKLDALRVEYAKIMGIEQNDNFMEYIKYFPMYWINSNDTEKKIRIINEAIEKKIKISEVSEYLDLVEGINYKKRKDCIK